MNEYIKSFKGFYEYVDSYMKKYADRPQRDRTHASAIQFAGEYYEEYQKEIQESGENEFLNKACQLFQDFQLAVEEHDWHKLERLYSDAGEFIRQEEGRAAWREKFNEVIQKDLEQMKLQQEKCKSGQALVDMDKKMYGEVTAMTKETLEACHLELVEGEVVEAGKNVEKLHIPQKEVADSVFPAMEDLLKRHEDRLKAQKEVSGKKTLVVNAFAGPGAGKTTACFETAAELKKMGYVVEYVPEYAKELVYDNPERLDGSKENQLHILEEQLKRLNRFMGKVDIIVTDASLMLNPVYLAQPDKEYEAAVSKLYQQYNNFNFFVHRGEGYVQEGRMENQEESIRKDSQIRDILEKNGLFYGNFNHQTVDKLAKKIEITYKRIANNGPEQEQESQKPYQAIAYFKKTTDKPAFLYGDSPEELIARLQKENQDREEEMQFHSCYIRKFNPETARYENPARFEVASGKDITPIYLSLPPMGREEFRKTVDQLKKDGAKFNGTKKAFYVMKGEVDLTKFAAYLPVAGTRASKGENRSHQEQNKGSKSPQQGGEKGKDDKESVRGKLEANKGKIEALLNESPALEKAVNEYSR